MRIKPLPPDTLNTELRQVHEEIVRLIGRSQSQVSMIDSTGALLGPFPPMLHYPKFGIPALSFMRTLDKYATIDSKVREVTILTVAGVLNARFILYAHEIMAETFGLSANVIASLATGGQPLGLTEQESIAHNIAHALVKGHIIPSSTYKQAVSMFGQEALAELYFLIGSYSLISMIVNGFDVPAPIKN